MGSSKETTKEKKPERFPCSWSIRFYELGRTEKTPVSHIAKCKSFNQDSLEITSIIPLTPKRLVLIELDIKLLESVIPIKNILILHERILTEVDSRHLNLETGIFEARLKFISVARADEFQDVLIRCVPTLTK